MKWKKWFIISWVLIICVAIGYSIHFKSTIPTTDLSKNIDEFEVYTSDYYDTGVEQYFQTDGVTMKDLYDSSDLVVKVRATSERKAKYESMLTKVKVLDVYKGDNALLDQDIYVYEHTNLLYTDEGFKLDISMQCNLMQVDREYYLLLEFFKQPEGYKYDSVSSRTYLLHNICYGKFSDLEYADLPDINIEEGITYGEVSGLDVLYNPKDDKDKILDYYQKRADFLDIIS